jgi:hypothetical protein
VLNRGSLPGRSIPKREGPGREPLRPGLIP